MGARFDTLGTLGDPPHDQLTSSFHVAMKSGLARKVIAFPSFEQAVEAARLQEIDVAMVAGAYPRLREFVMDRTIQCVDAFVETIPSLVAVGQQDAPPAKVHTVYLHPATLSLLDDLSIAYENVVETSATSAAAAKAAEDPDAIAICNQLAADHFRLTVFEVLRPDLRMPFILFRKTP